MNKQRNGQKLLDWCDNCKKQTKQIRRGVGGGRILTRCLECGGYRHEG